MKKQTNRSWQQRTLVAQTAAKIMVHDGIRDFQLAKNKAADQLGLSRHSPNMPRNREIDEALREYQRIFQADSQPLQIRRLRQLACEAMRFLSDFRPRLVGPVLSGSATEHSMIHLHVFAESPELLTMHLMDRGIPYETGERRLRTGPMQHVDYPVIRFLVDEVPFELVVFDRDGLRRPPLSQIDGRPMARATRAQVERLIDEDAPGQDAA
ncbi:MAG: hypothetical protein SVU69_06210 [Pseudomonadota bacterium]|nr:hypothetical protein [Pseudomonadota bacterium]